MSIENRTGLELLTIPEVGTILKISVPTVRRLQQQRKIPFFKVGGCVRFIRSDIDAYLQKRRVRSVDEYQ
ncbi:helix-turn-helix domain-containing protein [Bradyrhizobium sp. CCGUVB1N3]|uniref:helix-turn-helix domain-containing protein n=1 Tax=Bradyrhizobium sp. CCGUVB1N3 TaxID=2949629 RepID=UPI0020B43172|nr:helix-turn-helix domain-containing protein [Bradyrhizobium sp. CCGUVB1N3]MCP3475064.1 helix-turn-helix domain-containing protein [Bradyrhizobium sp. CCGUVB1N3]